MPRAPERSERDENRSGRAACPCPPELLAQLDPSALFFPRAERENANANPSAPDVGQLPPCLRSGGPVAKLYRNKIIERAFDPAITPHYLRHTYYYQPAPTDIGLKNRAVPHGARQYHHHRKYL